MIRKQVYIEARQDRSLKRRARETGVSEAELVRRGIDALERGANATVSEPHLWRAARAYILRQRRAAVPQTGRTWRRDDLYVERVNARSR